MATDKMFWYCLPAEIRIMILKVLLQDGCSLARFATVSREWQMMIEQHNFARIKVTLSRLANFRSMTRRNRALVRYIWLCVELQKYSCARCAPKYYERDKWEISNTDNILIIIAIQSLFSILSTWEPNGNLLLDISVHSPSDSEHWFKYLKFEPDVPADELDPDLYTKQSIPAKRDRHTYDLNTMPSHNEKAKDAVHKIFDERMGQGPFDDKNRCNKWYKQLPIAPVVTGLLLRQQTHRRLSASKLAKILTRLPRLQEVWYEPWRELLDFVNYWTDECYYQLFEWLALASTKVRRFTLFENFSEQYTRVLLPCNDFVDPNRNPHAYVSEAAAKASLNIERLSVSFVVDASYFFRACEPSWKWPNLTSLTLTSELLTPDHSACEIEDMLQMAATVAMNMPSLQSMEIWNGREGLAMLFRYQLSRQWEPAVITWRGTRKFFLQSPVVEAWEAVTRKRCNRGLIIVEEFLDDDAIKSHGDAIHHLNFLNPVIRPISLLQIRRDHRLCEEIHGW